MNETQLKYLKTCKYNFFLFKYIIKYHSFTCCVVVFVSCHKPPALTQNSKSLRSKHNTSRIIHLFCSFILLFLSLLKDRFSTSTDRERSVLVPFKVCQPSSLLIRFQSYQSQREEGKKVPHTFRVVPITAAGSGREGSVFVQSCNSTPPPAHR